MGIKIGIAIVTNRQVKALTVLSLMNMVAHTQHETFPIVATEGFTIAENRAYCVFKALNNNCTHILFIDDDMTFPENTIERLLAHNKAIVGVASNSRMLPLRPTVAGLTEDGGPKVFDSPKQLPDQPFKCYSVGMGVALVDCSVFDVIEKPWFEFHVAPTGKIITGEDEHLCNQVRAKGLEVYCDPTLKIGHLGEYTY